MPEVLKSTCHKFFSNIVHYEFRINQQNEKGLQLFGSLLDMQSSCLKSFVTF